MKGIKDFFCASPASTAIVSGRRERRRGGTCSSYDGEKRIRSRSSEQSDLRRKSSADAVVRSRELVSFDSQLSPNSISSVSSVDSEHAALCPSPECDYETFGVVDLEVAIDCKACERKVRKHISKMKGVKSFSIEMETKKVTIRGDVSPLGVLESVSKVAKKCDFLPLLSSCCTTRYGRVGCTQNPWTHHASAWVCNPTPRACDSATWFCNPTVYSHNQVAWSCDMMD